MPHPGQDLTTRHAVAAQPIRHDAAGLVLQASEQALEEPLGGRGISPILDQNVEYDAVLIHRAPEVEQLAVDPQVDLILSAKSGCLRQSRKSGHARLGPWRTIKPSHHA
jgi:hypothetical protein